MFVEQSETVPKAAEEITVQKPQFNTELLAPGTAVVYRKEDHRGYKQIEANALVTYAAPLKIGVVFLGKEKPYDGELREVHKDVSINQIVDKTVTIKIIKGAVDQ